MSDEEVRRLERAFRESGSRDDARAWLAARVRSGEIDASPEPCPSCGCVAALPRMVALQHGIPPDRGVCAACGTIWLTGVLKEVGSAGRKTRFPAVQTEVGTNTRFDSISHILDAVRVWDEAGMTRATFRTGLSSAPYTVDEALEEVGWGLESWTGTVGQEDSIMVVRKRGPDTPEFVGACEGCGTTIREADYYVLDPEDSIVLCRECHDPGDWEQLDPVRQRLISSSVRSIVETSPPMETCPRCGLMYTPVPGRDHLCMDSSGNYTYRGI